MIGAFHVPSTVLIGGGARRELASQLQHVDARRVLLVTDEGMMRLGPGREAAEMISEAGKEVVVFDDVQPDPTDRNVRAGLARYQKEQCDTIVAVGGGSPIDAAKAIRILVTNQPPLEQYAGYHK